MNKRETRSVETRNNHNAFPCFAALGRNANAKQSVVMATDCGAAGHGGALEQ